MVATQVRRNCGVSGVNQRCALTEYSVQQTKASTISGSPPCSRRPPPSARLQTAMAAPTTVIRAAGPNPRSSGAPATSRIVTAP